MAKRKNPLKDLDAFLKQESTSFVNPEKIGENEKNEPEASPAISQTPREVTPAAQQKGISKEVIISELQALANKEGEDFRSSFYSIIRETIEHLNHSTAEDKMLINTLLYLNDKPNWKDNIKNYWQSR